MNLTCCWTFLWLQMQTSTAFLREVRGDGEWSYHGAAERRAATANRDGRWEAFWRESHLRKKGKGGEERRNHRIVRSSTFCVQIVRSCDSKLSIQRNVDIGLQNPISFWIKDCCINIYPYQYFPQVPKESVAKVSTVN